MLWLIQQLPPVLDTRASHPMNENGVSFFLTPYPVRLSESRITQLLQSVPIRRATFDIEPGVRRES